MRVKINHSFSIWSLFVHDAHILGALAEDSFQEWINEELCGTGFEIRGPEETGSRSWNLYCGEFNCTNVRFYNSTEVEKWIKETEPRAYGLLTDLDESEVLL